MKSRLLVVTTKISDGGAERFASNLLQRLDRDRFEVHLCSLRRDSGYDIPADVQVSFADYRGVATLPFAVRRLRKLIDQERPDIVLSCLNATNIVAGFAVGQAAHRPRWVARVGSSPQQADRGLRRWALKKAYMKTDLIVVNAKELRDEMVKCYRLKPERIQVAANLCDFTQIRAAAVRGETLPRKADIRLVACGRLAHQKRYDIMLRAVARLQDQTSVELLICGDGPLKSQLKDLALDLGVSDRVEFLGFLDNPHSVMASGDVFILTSDYEGLPNALIEAQALGLAAVSTDCPTGPREIIEQGVTGLLVPKGDDEALVEAMRKLIAEPSARQRMAAEARARIEKKYDLESVIRQWQELLLMGSTDGVKGDSCASKAHS